MSTVDVSGTATSTQRLYGLHELVLSSLEEEIQSGEFNPKTIELAMKFLKDNNISVDLTATSKEDELKLKMASIPRLSPEDLELT